MLVKTYGSAVHGINATTITIETNIGQGVNFFLVGCGFPAMGFSIALYPQHNFY